MEFSLKNLPQSQIEIIISLSSSDLQPYHNQALKELGEKIQLDGFRPGKIPLDILEKKLSPLEIGEREIFLALQKIYPQIVQEQKLEVIGYPEFHLTKLIPQKEAEVKVIVAIVPQFKLPDYFKLAQETSWPEIKIEPSEVNEALEWLRKNRAKLQSIKDRAAQKGDFVTIDYTIQDLEQKTEKKQIKDYSFKIGENSLLKELENAVIGLNLNEKKLVTFKLPGNWPEKSLSQQKVQAEITLKEIKEEILPPLDDKFAQSLGKFATLEELKKSITEGLKIEKENQTKEKWHIEVLDKIAAQTSIEIPQVLLDAEIEKMIAELKDSLKEIQLTFPEYLRQIKKDEEELKKELQPLALKRVKASLILREIALKENIQVSSEEIEEKANQILSRMFDPEIKEKVNPEDLRAFSVNLLRNEKVFQLLEEQRKQKQTESN